MNNKLFKIILVLTILALVFTGYEILRLAHKVENIEKRLGGVKMIGCSEQETVKKVRQSVVRVIGGESEGSGFAIKENGFILTNFHVISNEPAPKIVLPDNTFEIGEVIMADKDADLAVIKIKRNLPVLKFARLDTLYPAEELLSIGYPLGGGLSGESFVIRGTFSRSSRDKENDVKYLLTDMTLIEGISGGPMVNICGQVVGVNTAGLVLGGMAIAVSSDSIFAKYQRMAVSKEPLKDVKKIIFEPNKNALEAVRCFYNYLKTRQMERAFTLLSDNFVKEYSFEYWQRGYKPMLDTSVILIKRDKKIANRINIKLSTKDLIDDEIVYKYFEGYWDLRQIDGKWLLWQPKIREVKNPDKDWFLDMELIKEIEAFVKTRKDAEEYKFVMYDLSQEPGNDNLSIPELYKKAKQPQNQAN